MDSNDRIGSVIGVGNIACRAVVVLRKKPVGKMLLIVLLGSLLFWVTKYGLKTLLLFLAPLI